MHKDQRETSGLYRFRLPMAMAKHAGSVGRIHFDGLGNGSQRKGRPRKIIPHNRLQMPIAKPPARQKAVSHAGREAGTEIRTRQSRRSLCIFMGLRGHSDSANSANRVHSPAARADWGG